MGAGVAVDAVDIGAIVDVVVGVYIEAVAEV